LEKPPSVIGDDRLRQGPATPGYESRHPELRDVLLPFLAKTEKDRRHLLLREGFKSLLDDGAMKALSLLIIFGYSVAVSAQSTGSLAERQVQTYATRYGVPPELIAALIDVESSWNPKAVSSKGAKGRWG
jgi:soluble lytic murein transglycosylase-like protein